MMASRATGWPPDTTAPIVRADDNARKREDPRRCAASLPLLVPAKGGTPRHAHATRTHDPLRLPRPLPRPDHQGGQPHLPAALHRRARPDARLRPRAPRATPARRAGPRHPRRRPRPARGAIGHDRRRDGLRQVVRRRGGGVLLGHAAHSRPVPAAPDAEVGARDPRDGAPARRSPSRARSPTWSASARPTPGRRRRSGYPGRSPPPSHHSSSSSAARRRSCPTPGARRRSRGRSTGRARRGGASSAARTASRRSPTTRASP